MSARTFDVGGGPIKNLRFYGLTPIHAWQECRFNLVSGGVIGFLRFAGVLIAAVWLGAALFFTLGVAPAMTSKEMETLLGHNNYGYFSVAIGQLLASTYYRLFLTCAVLAVLHAVTEWLYLGKYLPRFWLWLLLVLLGLGLLQVAVIQPRWKEANRQHYSPGRPETREHGARSARVYDILSLGFQLIMVGGVAIYFWRAALVPNPTRFVSTGKFRS